MSFSNGFEKTAGLGGLVGAAAGTGAKATQTAVKGVQNFAQKQRVDRVNSYRSALSGKKPMAGGDLAKSKSVLQRSDSMQASAARRKQTFAQKHPLLTAGGVLLGAKALMGGGEQQQPTQPPQVVQY